MNTKKKSIRLSDFISINSIKNIILFFFLIIFVLFLIDIFVIKNFLYSYVYEEWLINYSQGFVRRGLPGSILLLLDSKYNLDIFKIIKLFSYFTFFLFSIIYIFKVRHSQKVLDLESLMVVLFLPSLILFPLHDPNVIGRKEFLFFFSLLLNLFFLEKAIRIINLPIVHNLEYEQSLKIVINQYSFSLFIGYNLLSIPTALSHESILFLSLPINMIITSSLFHLKFDIKKVLLRTFIVYCPTIFVTFLCFIFQGNELSALIICQSWQEYINQYQSINCNPDYLPAKEMITLTDNVPLVLQYIGLPIRYFVKEVWRNNIVGPNLVFFKWIFAFLLCTIILMRTSSRILINSVEKLQSKIKIHSQDNISLELFSTINLVDVISIFSFKYAFIPFIFSCVLYI